MERVCKNCYTTFEDNKKLESKSNIDAFCSGYCKKEYNIRWSRGGNTNEKTI